MFIKYLTSLAVINVYVHIWWLLFYIVIDAVLPSDDDLMKNGSFMFQKNVRMEPNRAPVPGIRIPMSVVHKQSMKKG